jgi:hypothetical protein
MSGDRGEPRPRRRPGEFETVRQIRGAHREAGRYWFAESASRYFGTRIHDVVYGGRYFVTSEKDPLGVWRDGQRRYSVRRVNDDLDVETVGKFGAYATARAAHKAARQAAEGDDHE